MSAEKSSDVRSEDELGIKWDRCLSDSMLKVGAGVGLGVIFSFLFFKRKGWPVALGAGIGIGSGYTNCQNDMRQFGRLPLTPASSPPPAQQKQ